MVHPISCYQCFVLFPENVNKCRYWSYLRSRVCCSLILSFIELHVELSFLAINRTLSFPGRLSIRLCNTWSLLRRWRCLRSCLFTQGQISNVLLNGNFVLLVRIWNLTTVPVWQFWDIRCIRLKVSYFLISLLFRTSSWGLLVKTRAEF